MASDKCIAVLENLDNEQKQEVCQKKSIRSLVGCEASRLRNTKGLAFGDSMKEAWKTAKSFCADK